MSLARTGAVLRQELGFHLRRPLVICWLLLLALLLWGLSAGGVLLSSGDSTVGGTKAHITSEFALSQTFAILTPILYTFFVAVMVGLSILRDDEHKIGELLHSTPLRPAEYVWGKFGAGLMAILIVLTLHVLFAAFFNHVATDAASSDFVGEFEWMNYVWPALGFGLPAAVLTAGVAFWIGAWTRSAVAVFILPLVGLAACIFFLWAFTPSWLDYRIDRALMLIDPTGLRWLNRTWLDVDQGVDFYNTTRVPYDLPFLASRIAFVVLGLFGGLWTALRFRVAPASSKVKRRRKNAAIEEPQLEAAGRPGSSPLAALGMRTRRPSILMSFLRVLRVELRELRAQPGLYLFIPLILLDTLSEQTFQEGPFGTEINQTSGNLAVGSVPGLTFLVAILLMFYTVESLRRESKLGLAGLRDTTPVRSSVVLAAKISANAVVGAVVLLTALFACWLVLVFQGGGPLDPMPFLIVWGGLLVPTYVVWCAFVAFLYALMRNAYATYAVALVAIIGTIWMLAMGHMNWARNWILWSAISWSDFGLFPLDREALLWNRILALAGAALFLVLALRLFPRVERDAQRTLTRLRPLALLKSSLLIAPFAVVVIGLYVWISFQVNHGWDGEYALNEQKDYWRRNVETWRDAPKPDITSANISLVLEPEQRRLNTKGTYELANRTEKAMKSFALSGNPRWDELSWEIEGESYEADNREHLHVFTPPAPLAPGDSITVGFELSGVLHPRFSENGANVMEFVVPEGVVLTSFGPSFVPTVGFIEGIGIDEDNQVDSKDWPDDFYEGDTRSAFGQNGAFPVRMEVTCPERYTANGIGVKTSDEVTGGLRTVVWETDHPVAFFNVVIGEYEVAQGEGTAIYHHPDHTANVPGMLEALDAARARYSEWFYPFPWEELKLSEFPALAQYAQGFATNITFSEGIGFLARVTEEVDAPFTVTAHEAAHQWWGNLLVPGEGPGGNILSEGMSHFSTILLTESERGLSRRIQLCRRLEESYGEQRVADSERPLVGIDGSRPGDTTVTYDKGGWVFWMLLNQMGREACLAGLQNFIAHYQTSRDHPVLQDFIAHMRPFAPDAEAFDAFVQQWFLEVALPRFTLRDVVLEEGPTGPERVTLTLVNEGTGSVSVEIGAFAGPRFEDEAAESESGPDDTLDESDVLPAERHEARETVVIGAGEEVAVTIPVDFVPDVVVVDPDALVLQLDRMLAEHVF